MINLEKKTKELEGINFVAFSNNVVVVNTTPHPVTIQDMDGTLITVPTSVLINAKAEERKVSDLFVRTEFVGTEERQGFSEAKPMYSLMDCGIRKGNYSLLTTSQRIWHSF